MSIDQIAESLEEEPGCIIWLGKMARIQGRPVESNPYPSGDKREFSWYFGWYQADEDLSDSALANEKVLRPEASRSGSSCGTQSGSQ